MLDRILLTVDGTEIFSETLGYLRELNLDSATEVFLLHVIPPGREKYTAVSAPYHPLLKRYYDAMDSDGWKVTAELRSGEPIEEITQFAVQTKASLLVMSTHGRSGLDKICAGSITEQVVRQSPCPTFILHSTRDDTSVARQGRLFHRMLVPLDGTEDSAAILPCVEQFAKRYHTEVVLFHDHPDCDESNEAKNRREFLGHHGVELANAGISVQLDCSTHRRPIHEILKRTYELDIDIVAMATHGSGGERRPLEESVTANVMRHSSRPLLVWSSDPQCPPAG